MNYLPSPATAVISAVPFDRLEVSPILGVHLWFEKPIMDLPHLVLVDHDVQWLFNKGMDLEGRQHIHAVISAADEWMTRPSAQIIEQITADVHRALPGAVGLQPVAARCIKEKRATFCATPQAEPLRPSARSEHARGTGIENLYLAGDWCDTGWPATMEGAVRSGYIASSEICRDDDREAPGLVEDVPAGWLARALRRN